MAASSSLEWFADHALAESFAQLKLEEHKYIPVAAATHDNQIPTWGQLKALANGAQALASTNSLPASPQNLLVGMLALLAAEVSFSCLPMTNAQEFGNSLPEWVYIPGPPILQVATWDIDLIKVTTDNVDLLGGESNNYLTQQ